MRTALAAAGLLALLARPHLPGPDLGSGGPADPAARHGTPSSEAGVAGDGELLVATYNLKYASLAPPNAWPLRRGLVRELLTTRAPDLIGTQEGTYAQLRQIDEDLPEHDWIGLGREGGSRGEFMAVYYRAERLEPLAFDHFWLSEEPERIASKSWGSSLPRMATWVRFRDRATGETFVLLNTHFDHRSASAREGGAALIAERCADLWPDEPLLVTGDFNALAGSSRPYRVLVEETELVDAWTVAEERGPDLNTYGGWKPPAEDGRRIDWILARGAVRVLAADVDTFHRGEAWPSDHLPVFARVLLGAGAGSEGDDEDGRR